MEKTPSTAWTCCINTRWNVERLQRRLTAEVTRLTSTCVGLAVNLKLDSKAEGNTDAGMRQVLPWVCLCVCCCAGNVVVGLVPD